MSPRNGRAMRSRRRVVVILWVTRGTAGQALRPSVMSVLGAGSKVVEAAGSAKALWQLSNRRPFDVVIMECGVGERRQNHSGCVDLIRSMFRRWPWMPVVLVGTAPERLRADVLLTGVRAFLTERFTVGGSSASSRESRAGAARPCRASPPSRRSDGSSPCSTSTPARRQASATWRE